MPADKRSEASDDIASAPPVGSDVLRAHELKPLARAGAASSPKGAAGKDQEGSGKDLPPDITANDETDRAVEAISEQEADDALAIEDEELEVEKDSSKHRVRDFFSAWLGTKRGWRWTLAALFVLVVCVGIMPRTRYWILNTVGVRCSLSITTIDGDTQLSLPGVTVQDGQEKGQTNHAGYVMLSNLKLGPQKLVLSRPGFARVVQEVTLGWGGNPLGSQSLKDVGQQYTILVHDYVSGTTLRTASANSNGLTALADKNGKITLTLDNASEQPVQVSISAPGYTTKSVTLSGPPAKPTSVALAPSAKEVYVQNSSGLYNLYSSTVDGQEKQQLLAGTATETSAIALSVSPDNSQAALVSTRDPSYDNSGQLLTALTLVNVNNGTPLTIDHAEQIQLIGWIGDAIIYEEQTTSGTSSDYNVIAYNYSTNSRDQLATATQFTDVTIAGGTVYYAIPAAASSTANGFYAVKADGSDRQTILSKDVWSVQRANYSTFNIQTATGWYTFDIGGSSAASLNGAPSSMVNRQYLDSPDGSQSAWVNTTDSSSQLLVYNLATGQDHSLSTVAGIAYPLRWLNNGDLMYRVTTPLGSYDYVVNVNGGSSKRVVSLVDTQGLAPN